MENCGFGTQYSIVQFLLLGIIYNSFLYLDYVTWFLICLLELRVYRKQRLLGIPKPHLWDYTSYVVVAGSRTSIIVVIVRMLYYAFTSAYSFSGLLWIVFPWAEVYQKQILYLWSRGKVCVHSILPRPHFVGLHWVYCWYDYNILAGSPYSLCILNILLISPLD